MKLIEKMARAIDAAEVAWCSQHQDKSVADMPDTLKAIAALKAMREPSEGMLKAGDLPGWDDSVTIGLSEEVWQAMIDAAIKEAEGE